ncbi:MAG TPA: HAD-IC family P-type ATPase [Candidatus Paceibacterota bacterium]
MSVLPAEHTVALAHEDIVQPFWSLSIEDALRFLKTSRDGLTEEEAAARLHAFGYNEIPEGRRFTQLALIFNQFKSPLIVILVIASLATAFLGEWIETGVIAAAILVNACLGFYQEHKTEHVLRVLKSYIRTRSRVRRVGREYEIDASELVPGDVIRVNQGDRIPADGRIVFANNFVVDEAILTGESLPVHKVVLAVELATMLGDRSNMIFSGALASEGMAEAVVVATGVYTEFGKIAAFVGARKQERTPLQHAMDRFSARAGLALGILVAGMFFFGLLSGFKLFDIFLISVAVAVSAVPEGLPIALTVILAVGVERLGRRKGIVRKLLAAETLGSTNIILTDKTGTLTQAKMELSDIVFSDEKRMLLSDALMNVDVLIENPEESVADWKVIGRPMEIALVQGAARNDVLLPQAQKKSQRIDLLPFNSTNKFSVSLFRRESRTRLVIVGAPEIVLDFADISLPLRERILQEVTARAFAGERILGVVSKEVPAGYEKLIPFHEHDTKEWQHQFLHYQFRGLLSFRDPLRPTVKNAILRIRRSGIRTIIVTGDHRGTALAVARDLDIAHGENELLTGDDLVHLDRDELKNRLAYVNVFARVTPEQKLMLTQLFRETGAVVAVTGDGINDAPALAVADIGVAVGSGTDVTKNQADLVILDNNFETIVAAIEEGRTILDNIRKVIVYLLSNSLDEILLIGGAILAGLALPLNALQILFVNFFSDSFPALAFAFERGIDDLDEKPRKLEKDLFDRQMRFLIFGIGFLTSAFLFVLYYVLLRAGFDGDIVRTFIFASFASYTLFLAFSLRSLKTSIIRYNPFTNPYLVVGAGVGLLLTLAALYVPRLGAILGTTPLPFWWLVGVVGIGALNIILVELSKWLFRKHII